MLIKKKSKKNYPHEAKGSSFSKIRVRKILDDYMYMHYIYIIIMYFNASINKTVKVGDKDE